MSSSFFSQLRSLAQSSTERLEAAQNEYSNPKNSVQKMLTAERLLDQIKLEQENMKVDKINNPH